MPIKEAIPRDAAAVILIREDAGEVFLARRNPKISFLGGYYAFPGGKLDAEDAEIPVRNCEDGELARFIVCAARETFEEIGVLLVRGGDKITKGQRASLHDDLTAGRFSFREILETWNLRIDREDFDYAGFWTTPAFSPVRFKTRFFAAVCPRRQSPETFGEFVEGEFTTAKDALRRWEKSEILIAPPVLIALQTLAREFEMPRRGDDEQWKTDSEQRTIRHSDYPLFLSASQRLSVEKLLEKSQTANGEIRLIRFNPFVTCFPLRTETLPPATHTNCFIVGAEEFVVIDPASGFADEQAALHEYIDSRITEGEICRKIFITHEHKDHTGGAVALQKHLRERFGALVPIAAHRLTAERLPAEIKVDEFVEDGGQMEFYSPANGTQIMEILHAPGHARGHLCFYFEQLGFLLSGDNVIGTGSILIAPPSGNMRDYLASLERMKNLPNLRFLGGAHGAAVADARGKIESYIAHRLEREQKIIEAVSDGAQTAREIVERVYTDVSPELWQLAERSVEAHLEKLQEVIARGREEREDF